MDKIYFIRLYLTSSKNKFQELLQKNLRSLDHKTISHDNIPLIKDIYNQAIEEYHNLNGRAKIDAYTESNVCHQMNRLNGDISIHIGEIIVIRLHLINGEIK